MISKIVHIGFGKCGSSKLQKDIFPYIANLKKLKYWGDEYKSSDPERNKLSNLLLNHITKMELGLDTDFLDIENNYFISNEELSSYRDADLIKDFAEKNLKAFGEDTHIILIIREPKNWLSSVFVQLCIHENPIQKPETFFLTQSEYSSRLPDQKFNIDKFSYKEIIDNYKDKFKCFTFIKYEKLDEMEAIAKIFDLNQNDVDLLKKKYSKNYVNKSLSKKSVKFLWKLNSFFNIFGLSFSHKYTNKVRLQRADGDNLELNKKESSFYIFHKIVRSVFNYKMIFQKFLDKLLPYEKYVIDFNELKKVDIKKLEEEYKNLPDYKTFNNS